MLSLTSARLNPMNKYWMEWTLCPFLQCMLQMLINNYCCLTHAEAPLEWFLIPLTFIVQMFPLPVLAILMIILYQLEIMTSNIQCFSIQSVNSWLPGFHSSLNMAYFHFSAFTASPEIPSHSWSITMHMDIWKNTLQRRTCVVQHELTNDRSWDMQATIWRINATNYNSFTAKHQHAFQ